MANEQFNLEKSKILFNQFLEWHHAKGIQFFLDSHKNYSFLYESEYFFEQLEKVSMFEQAFQAEIRKKIAKTAYNELLVKFKNNENFKEKDFQKIEKLLHNLEPEERQNIWKVAIESNKVHFIFFLYEFMRKNFISDSNSYMHIMLNCNIQKEAFEKLKEAKNFNYQHPYILTHLLAKNRFDLIAPFFNKKNAEDVFDYIKQKEGKKLFHNLQLVDHYNSVLKDQYKNETSQIWPALNNNAIQPLDCFFFFANPKASYKFMSSYIQNMELPEKFLKKVVDNQSFSAEDKVALFEAVKFDPSKLTPIELTQIKSQKDFKLMAWLIDNNADYLGHIKPIDLSRVPEEHRHKIKMVTVLSFWKKRINSDNYKILENSILKKEFINTNVKKVKLL